jgi:hypothetical protein
MASCFASGRGDSEENVEPVYVSVSGSTFISQAARSRDDDVCITRIENCSQAMGDFQRWIIILRGMYTYEENGKVDRVVNVLSYPTFKQSP